MFSKTLALYKQAYGGLSSSTWWLSLVMLINRSGTMVVPFLTIYLTDEIHVSIGKATLVMSLFGLGAVIGALLGGRLTDAIGYYYVQLFTIVGGGIMFLILGQLHSYSSICIGTFCLSFVNEAFRPANSVAIAHYSKPENVTRSYSLNRLAINLGWAFGGALGGFIAEIDYELLFWVDGLTNISAAFLLFFLLPFKKDVHAKKKEPAGLVTRSAYQDRIYMIFIFFVFLFAVSFFQLFTTIPVFYNKGLHLSKFTIGIIMSLNGLIIALFEMIIIFRLEGKRSYLHYIALGTFLIGTSYLILNVPIEQGLFIGLASTLLVTMGEIISMPFMNSWWLARAQLSNRGQYAAMYTVAWASAQTTGPFFAGQLVESYGYKWLWNWIGIVSVFLAVAFYWLNKKDTLARG